MNRSRNVVPAHMVYRREKMNRLTDMMDMRLEFVDELGDLVQELSSSEMRRYEVMLKRDRIASLVRAVDSEYDGEPVHFELWDDFVTAQEWNPDETGDLDWSKFEW